jgi:alkanesulfonate monooxygenase SsuD/methylene tetrahydromethanopterin reductase-like flavin-dependent oxidoreductase (luciferase family)
MGGPEDAEEFARAAEEMGADALGYGESPSQFRDPYIRMARAAQLTKRILMGTVVSCPGLRHPATHANTLQTLQNISEGRIFAGIGTGDLALIEMGERPFKMNDFVAYAAAVRDLASGREIEWASHPLKMRTPPSAPVPIWFGADGPRGLAAAGERADGAIIAQVGGPDVVRAVLQRVGASAEAAGRSMDDLDIWFMLRVVPTKEEDGAINIDGLDEYATRALRFLWRTAAPKEGHDLPDILLKQRGYRIDSGVADRLHQFNLRWDEAQSYNSKYHVKLMDELDLRRFAGRYFFISGPRELIVERVQALIDAGARNFFTPILVGDRLETLRETADILNSMR